MKFKKLFITCLIIHFAFAAIAGKKTTNTIPFQGNYLTQKLSFGDGLSGWSKNLEFSDCIKDTCAYELTFCQNDAGNLDCSQESVGRVHFLDESTFEIKPLCKNKVKLNRIGKEWKISNPLDCAEMPQIITPLNSDKVEIYKTGFNCLASNLSAVELHICMSEKLAKLDRSLSQLFKSRPHLKKDQVLKIQQEKWLKDRDNCNQTIDPIDCLIKTYELRLKEIKKR